MDNYLGPYSGNALERSYRLRDVPGAALKNLPGSLNGIAEGVNSLARNTPGFLADTWHGKPIPFESVIGAARVLGGMYAKRYGSYDAIKRTMAEDPAGFTTDVLGLLSGGAGGIAGRTKVVGKARPVTTTVPNNRWTNPNFNALRQQPATMENRLAAEYGPVSGNVAKTPAVETKPVFSAVKSGSFDAPFNNFNVDELAGFHRPGHLYRGIGSEEAVKDLLSNGFVRGGDQGGAWFGEHAMSSYSMPSKNQGFIIETDAPGQLFHSPDRTQGHYAAKKPLSLDHVTRIIKIDSPHTDYGARAAGLNNRPSKWEVIYERGE